MRGAKKNVSPELKLRANTNMEVREEYYFGIKIWFDDEARQ